MRTAQQDTPSLRAAESNRIRLAYEANDLAVCPARNGAGSPTSLTANKAEGLTIPRKVVASVVSTRNLWVVGESNPNLPGYEPGVHRTPTPRVGCGLIPEAASRFCISASTISISK